MATLSLITSALTTINRTKINVYKEPDRLAVIDTQTYSAPHAQRQWTFLNLEPSATYFLRWTEIDGAGLDIQTISELVITLPAAGSIEIKAPQQVTADVTPGWSADATTITMDGTSGTDDWRGWDIHIEKVGFGTQFTSENYNWDSSTGIITLTDAVSSLEKYYVEFQPKVKPSAVVSSQLFGAVKTITDDYEILTDDFGKNLLLIEGADDYLELTLPDIATVVELRPLYLKTSRIHHKCAAIISTDAGAIDWLGGGLDRVYMGICESLVLFRVGSSWQVINSDGNFKIVGERVSEYANIDLVLNKVALSGTVCNIRSHARLYFGYVNLLPPGETVAFSAWSTGRNRLKYSLADDATGNFYVPDLQGMVEKPVVADFLPGDYEADAVGPHGHDIEYILEGNDGTPTVAGQVLRKSATDNGTLSGQGGHGTNSYAVRLSTGTETKVRTAATRIYVRC